MASVTPTIVKRPLLSIQCDWSSVLRQPEGSVWVSYRELGNSSKHGKLTAEKTEDGSIKIKTTEDFIIQRVAPTCVILSYELQPSSCTFYAPHKIFSHIHQKGVLSMNVTLELGVSVCSENKLIVWDISNGRVLRTLEGHVWDVYSCRFFPSGIIVLSAGADMQIKIWSAENGQCPVTMTGHKAAITDTAIVERGRNVVSVSKDGTARLWDCGKASCLHVISQGNGTINTCAVAPVDIDLGVPDEPPSEREVLTAGKLLVFGTEDGILKGVGLQSHKQIFQFSCGSAVNCCCFVSSTTVAFGCHDGKIYLFDLRARQPATIWEESTSAVLCMLYLHNGLLCGRADGSCIFTSFDRDVSIQLSGPDFDPVNCIAYNGNEVFTASRDGAIRKYKVIF